MSKEQIEIRAEESAIDTGWANAPKLSDLKLDLTESNSHHSTHVSEVNAWLDNLNVTGSAKPKKVKGRSSVVPKLIRKQAEWRYAGLSEAFLSTENLFTTEPLTFEDGDAAVQNGLVLNNQFNTQLDKVTFIDHFVRTAVDEGSVIVRVGWETVEEEVEVDNFIPEQITSQFMREAVENGAAMMMRNPEAAQQQLPPELLKTIQLSLEIGEPVQMVIDENNPTRMEMKTLKNQPTLEVCDFAKVMIDPTCQGDLRKAQFVIYEFHTSTGDLERDGRYTNIDQIKIEKTALVGGSDTSENQHVEDTGSFMFNDAPRQQFKAYEYWGFWDIHDDGIPVAIVCTWVGLTMIRLEESPFPNKQLPFTLTHYLPKRKSVYGEPDGALLLENQKIAAAVTRGMIDTMGRSANGQVGIRKDALDVTNQRKFDAGKDYSYNPGVDPRVAFFTNTYPELPQSAQYMLALQNNDAESLTGVRAFANTGVSGEGLGKSATAARSALDAAAKREIGILRRLAKGVTDIGRMVMAMNAVLLSEEEVIRITNEEFITVKRDDLAGKIDIKLMISTAETDNIKAEELAFMLQTTGQSLPQEFSFLIMEEIARLRKMPELAKRIQEFQPEPDPMAQKMQELEIGKLEAEIRKIDSETED